MIAYTIVSRQFVPYARVLARSYSRHHSGSKLWALLIDDCDRDFDEANEPFRILHLEDLEIDGAELHRLEMIFSGKLIAVIKPWVFEHFLRRSAEPVMYIDADFVIFDSLNHVVDEAGSGVILVPHVLHPLPRDGKSPDETTVLGAGMFNAGMFGVGPDHGGFIAFMRERMRRECIFDARIQRFNEQRWLDFVPPLFPHHVVRDAGVDVAYWNLHERPLSLQNGKWFADGVPLRAFHFSSFDPRTHGVGGRFELDPSSRVRVGSTPGFSDLCETYRRELFENGFDDLHDTPFSFDSFPDGPPIYQSLRGLFTHAVLAADRGELAYPPDPFDPATNGAFRLWFEEQYRQAGLALPVRLASEHRPLHVGLRDKLTRKKRESRPVAAWTVDWLDRMIVDEAGQRTAEGGIRTTNDNVGFICHGPRAALDPGHYVATLEWDPHLGSDLAAVSEQAVVAEAFVQGYVVGSRAFTVSEIRSGAVELDIVIPEGFAQEALLFGLELRLLTRGGLDARLTAIVVDSFGHAAVPGPARFNWLPVMAGGVAGRRQGPELTTLSGHAGIVLSGPNWRLPPGRYRLEMLTRRKEPRRPGPTSPVGVLEVLVGERLLAATQLSTEDVDRGKTILNFAVTHDDAGPNDQVGACLRTDVPVELVVTSVMVERVDESITSPVPLSR